MTPLNYRPAMSALAWLLASAVTPEEKIQKAIACLRQYGFDESAPLNKPTTENDFDGLIETTHSGDYHETIIQGYRVRLILNPLSDKRLFALYIGECLSNSCLEGSMRKLLRDWKDGLRIAKPAEWAGPNSGLLMKKN